MKNLDNFFYNLPLLGIYFKTAYPYWKKNTILGNLTHMIYGLGIGLVLVGKEWLTFGLIALLITAILHIWAFVKGKAL